VRTVFEQRCDRAWQEQPELALLLSLHVLRRDRETVGSPSHLYVAHDADADAVKVGISTGPRFRLSNLNVGNPRPLRAIVTVPAPAGLERILHDWLSPDRLRGEWFRCTPRALVACELLLSARDFHDDAAADGEPAPADLTVEVLCQRANELLDLVTEAAA